VQAIGNRHREAAQARVLGFVAQFGAGGPDGVREPLARTVPLGVEGGQRAGVSLEERQVRAVAGDRHLHGQRALPAERGERLTDERRLAVAARGDEEDLLAAGQIGNQPVQLDLAVDEGLIRDDLAVYEGVLHSVT
jgi:hypothetical protein